MLTAAVITGLLSQDKLCWRDTISIVAITWRSKKYRTPKKTHKMTDLVYIISCSSIIGGIETLAVRLANELIKQEKAVVFSAPSGPIVEFVNNKAKMVLFKNNEFDEAIIDDIDKNFQQFRLNGIKKIWIWVSHPSGLIRVYRIQKYLKEKYGLDSIGRSGIFIPAAEGVLPRWAPSRLLRLLFNEVRSGGWLYRVLPIKSYYFMSETVKSSFIKYNGNYYNLIPVLRLPIMFSGLEWVCNPAESLRIVSVGRLTKFKAYNFGASDIVKELLDAGIECYWDIWGDGEELQLAKEYSEKIGVKDNVVFKGELKYSDFDKVVKEYDIFVGMGTAAVEAAALKMPVVVALMWSSDLAYGFIYDSPGDSIGEIDANAQKYKIGKILKEYHSVTPEQRIIIGRNCYEAVSKKVTCGSFTLEDLFSVGMSSENMDDVCFRMDALSFILSVKGFINSAVRRFSLS